MASATLQLAAGPSGNGAHLAPSPSASSSGLTVSPANSMQFLEGSPSSLFWRPGPSSREEGDAPTTEALPDEHPSPPEPAPPSPPRLDPLSNRFPKGPPAPHTDQLRAGYFGLGLAYQQTSVRDTAGESPEPGNESDHGDATRRVSVNALLSDSLLSLRQWWPKGANKDRSNLSLPVSVGYTESSVSGRVTPELGGQADFPAAAHSSQTLAPSPELPAETTRSKPAPKSLRIRPPNPVVLPTIAGSPNMEVLRRNRGKEPAPDPPTPTPQTAFFARRDSSPTVKLVRDNSSLSRQSSLSDKSEYVTPAQWVKRGSADLGLFEGGTRDSGVDVRQPIDWSKYQISPPPPARVSTSPQKNANIYREALPMEALVAGSSDIMATDVPPVTPQKPRRGLTINVMSPMSPTSPTSIMVVPARGAQHELQPTSPTSIMLIPSRYQQDNLLPPLSARSSHFSFISNMSTRRGLRAPSRMESDAHLRASSAAGGSGARIRPRSHLPTARTLFFLGFIGPWCWLLGGWLLEKSGSMRNRTPHRTRRSQKGGRGAWDTRHLAPTPDIDDMLQVDHSRLLSPEKPNAQLNASPVIPNAPHSTPAMAATAANPWQYCAYEPGETDLELAGLQVQRPDPWVVRCRIAAIISSFFILAGCIAALAIAFRVDRGG